eukprot:6840259-Pyramimonas_sp.AAC.1
MPSPNASPLSSSWPCSGQSRCRFANVKRGPPANSEIDDSTRVLLRSELLATSRGSKANVARVLQSLN